MERKAPSLGPLFARTMRWPQSKQRLRAQPPSWQRAKKPGAPDAQASPEPTSRGAVSQENTQVVKHPLRVARAKGKRLGRIRKKGEFLIWAPEDS